jgi:hypothetical protein
VTPSNRLAVREMMLRDMDPGWVRGSGSPFLYAPRARMPAVVVWGSPKRMEDALVDLQSEVAEARAGVKPEQLVAMLGALLDFTGVDAQPFLDERLDAGDIAGAQDLAIRCLEELPYRPAWLTDFLRNPAGQDFKALARQVVDPLRKAVRAQKDQALATVALDLPPPER